ncbi:hypothetical protein AABB24_010983 [Solanum stoloniferum]|uniref:Uncharacterized protein n=1 Tax=Solanum stoloniferum TaxID=62892 RepID=A0ABD2UB93_9SOLN
MEECVKHRTTSDLKKEFCSSTWFGLRWYAKRLRIDEDGDVADEFLNEIPPDAPSSTDENNRKFRKFELKYTTKPAKVTSQALSAAGKIKYRVEYQGKLEWI